MTILVLNHAGGWERWHGIDEIKKGPGSVIYIYTEGKLRSGLHPVKLEVIPEP